MRTPKCTHLPLKVGSCVRIDPCPPIVFPAAGVVGLCSSLLSRLPLIEASGTSRAAPPPPSNNVFSLLGEPGPGRRFPFSLFPDFPDGAPSRLPVEGARERFRFISVVSPGLRQSHATVFCLPSSPRFPVALRFSPGLSIPLIEASGTSRGAPPPPSNNVLSLLGEPGPGRRFPFSLFPDGAPSRLPVEG